MNEPIQEKAPKPPGLLPKHVQSWLILGLAALMIVIMWLTGGKNQKNAAKANTPARQTPPPVEVNETKIADLQNRIQELQHEQLVAQSALSQQNRMLAAAPPEQQQVQSSYAPGNPRGEHAEDPIKVERRKREYLSLFAPNIALTYRKSASATHLDQPETISPTPELLAAGPASTPTEAALLAQMLKQEQLGNLPQAISATPPDRCENPGMRPVPSRMVAISSARVRRLPISVSAGKVGGAPWRFAPWQPAQLFW